MPLLEADAPITRIPPEILARIFQMHVDATLPRFDKTSLHSPIVYGRVASPYSWIRINHVCQHWRNVSLASPLLWSTIVITHHTDCMQAMLERSQQVPLDVRTPGGVGCYSTRPVSIKPLRLVLDALYRIRTLELAINWWVYDDLIDLLQRPSPLLRTFRLSTPNGGHDGGWLCPIVSLSLPAEPPQFEELSLNCYVFPWSNPFPFRSLKHLRVDNSGLSRPPIEDIAYALGMMPHLVTLTLHGVLSSVDATMLARAKSEVIEMPGLEHVTLSGDSVSCSTLLKLLCFPESTRMILTYSSERNLDALALSMPCLKDKVVQGLDTTSSGCVSVFHTQTWCNILFHRTPPCNKLSTHSDFYLPKLNLRIAPSPDHLGTICHHLRFDGMHVLQMTLPLATDVTPWLAVFNHHENFEEIRLMRWQPPIINHLLAQGIDDWTDEERLLNAEDGARVIFPNMCTLVLSQVLFSGAAGSLRDALLARSNSKLRLNRLVLRNCNGLTTDDIPALTNVVNILDWDGRT